jgi:hypothetical protein
VQGATGRGIEGRRLLVLEKEAVSANQSRRPLRPRWVHTKLRKSITDQRLQRSMRWFQPMQHVGLTKKECKMHERNMERKGLLAAEVGSARVGGGSEYPARPASSFVQSELGHLACCSVLPVRGEQRGRLLADHDACYLSVPNWAGWLEPVLTY